MAVVGSRHDLLDTIHSFQLSLDALQEIRRCYAERIREGLGAADREILAIPAYLTAPSKPTVGEAFVVDAGGTNVRAAHTEVIANADGTSTLRIHEGPFNHELANINGVVRMSAEDFFRLQASLLPKTSGRRELAVGYCFSYPSAVQPPTSEGSLDATLKHWTKGIEIPGVEGTPVGKRLCDAMRSIGFRPRRVRVLNDTVAAALACAVRKPGAELVIGLICGTGTNMCAFYTPEEAPKLRGLVSAHASMAINLESGNFSPPEQYRTAVDRAVDAKSNRPGAQLFEKMVSGAYLGQLFAEAMPEHAHDVAAAGARGVAAVRRSAEDSLARELAASILDRSADLVATGLAAVIDTWRRPGLANVLAEGSTYWKNERFANRVEQTLTTLVAGQRAFEIVRVDHANLLGTTGAALSD
jgi:hexokinase